MESYWSYETREKKNLMKSKITSLQLLLTTGKDPSNMTDAFTQCKDSSKLHNTYDYEEAKKLLESGAGVNKRNGWGETPLHTALQEGKGYNFIKLLLEHGANVNAVSGLGRTPLHCILKHGQFADKRIINTLLSYGAEIDVHSRAYFSSSVNLMTSTIKRWYDRGDLALSKSLIKITLLYGYSANYCKTVKTMFCDTRPYCDEIREFTLNCLAEIKGLKLEYVSDNLSLFDIAISEPEELKLVPLKLQKDYSTIFTVYYDIIKSSCKMYMRRVVLFKVLECSQMVIISKTSNKEIFVDHHCLSMIGENLVNYDLDNFLKALFDVQTLNQKLKLLEIA